MSGLLWLYAAIRLPMLLNHARVNSSARFRIAGSSDSLTPSSWQRTAPQLNVVPLRTVMSSARELTFYTGAGHSAFRLAVVPPPESQPLTVAMTSRAKIVRRVPNAMPSAAEQKGHRPRRLGVGDSAITLRRGLVQRLGRRRASARRRPHACTPDRCRVPPAPAR